MKILVLCWLLLFPVSNLYAAGCTRHGESITLEGWSPQLKRVCLNDVVTSNSFISPDKRKTVIADLSGFRLRIDGVEVQWPGGLSMMANGAEVSWSPASSGFFINDGDGSGLDGWTLNVYTISKMNVRGHPEINQHIVRQYRESVACPNGAVDPNVRGLGWSAGGKSILAFAQATVNESCGQPAEFRGAIVDLNGSAVLRFYSEVLTKQSFHNILPFSMR